MNDQQPGVITAGCFMRCYNAAMEAEPKRKSRWYQFSLRTLLIGVMLLAGMCAYVAHEATIVRQRHEAVNVYQVLVGYSVDVDDRPGGKAIETRFPQAPWPLRLFGEDGYAQIIVPHPASDDEIRRLEYLFPEATIERAASN
jgi:hypothetical protein